MEVYTSNHEQVTLWNEPFSSGGEGEVRKVINAPSRFNDICVKIYYQKKRTQELECKIKYMVVNPPAIIRGKGFLIGWPLDYVTDASGNFLGFIMPLAFPNSEQLIKLTAPKLSNNLSEEWKVRYDRSNGVYALISRLKLLSNISIPIHLLHKTGHYVLRDFKPENVLINYQGYVTLVDMDSVQISENGKLLFPGTAATPNYIPPEYYTKGIGKNPNIILDESWDRFAIGVVFYQVLMGLHPYVVTPMTPINPDSNEIFMNISENLFPFGANSSKIKSYPGLHNKFRYLHPSARSLFIRAFSENPDDRPSAEEWGKCLHSLVNAAPEVPRPHPQTQPHPQPQPQPQPQPVSPDPVPTEPETSYSTSKDGIGLGWAILSIIVPIVGLILFFAKHDKVKNSSVYLLLGIVGLVFNYLVFFS